MGASSAIAKQLKDEGNTQFAARLYEEAEAQWTRALRLDSDLEDDQIRMALYSNRAEARLRRQLWKEALDDAETVLKMKPDHDKALLRGAVALREQKKYTEALDFVKRCVEANPRHPEAIAMQKELADKVEQDALE